MAGEPAICSPDPVVQSFCSMRARRAMQVTRCHFLKLLFRSVVQCARRAQKCFQMLSSRKSIFESFVKTAPICCHFSNLCISFYNLWDTFFDFLLRIDIYLHLLIRFALFLDMCPLICEDALLESSKPSSAYRLFTCF